LDEKGLVSVSHVPTFVPYANIVSQFLELLSGFGISRLGFEFGLKFVVSRTLLFGLYQVNVQRIMPNVH
jgi:hypothetical protein